MALGVEVWQLESNCRIHPGRVCPIHNDHHRFVNNDQRIATVESIVVCGNIGVDLILEYMSNPPTGRMAVVQTSKRRLYWCQRQERNDLESLEELANASIAR